MRLMGVNCVCDLVIGTWGILVRSESHVLCWDKVRFNGLLSQIRSHYPRLRFGQCGKCEYSITLLWISKHVQLKRRYMEHIT